VKLLGTPVQVGTTPPPEGRQRGVRQPTCDLGKITGIVDRRSIGSCEEPWPTPCQADDRYSQRSGLRDRHPRVLVKTGEQEDVCFAHLFQHFRARNPAQPFHTFVDAEALCEASHPLLVAPRTAHDQSPLREGGQDAQTEEDALPRLQPAGEDGDR
jgi:hypothetical protein